MTKAADLRPCASEPAGAAEATGAPAAGHQTAGEQTVSEQRLGLAGQERHMGSDQIEPFYVSRDGVTRLYGRVWTQVPRGSWEALRCTFRRHRRVQWGTSNLGYEERCSCGASRDRAAGAWRGGEPAMIRHHPSEDNLGWPF